MASSRGAVAQYLRLLRSAEGVGGKLEVGAGIARAALARLASGRGALHVRRPVVIADDGLRWFVPPLDNSFASAAPGERNSPVVPEIVRRLAATPRRVCVDVGANLGYVCMAVARRFPDRHVVAIEPIPWLAEALARTTALNGFTNVTVLARAVAPAGTVDLAVPRVRGVWLTTLSSGAARGSSEAARSARETVRVPAAPLDDLLAAAGVRPEDVGVVKIDVEGLEPAVLRTAPHLLAARPAVIFEALDDALRMEVEAVLRGAGYSHVAAVDDTNFVATP